MRILVGSHPSSHLVATELEPMAILHLILHLPVSRAHDGPHLRQDLSHFFQLLFHLAYQVAYILIELSKKCGQPDGVQSSTEYLRYLRGLHLDDDSFDASRNLVTTALMGIIYTSPVGSCGWECQGDGGPVP